MLQDELINKILIVSAIAIIIAYISAQLRASNIGWTYRDIFQSIAVTAICYLAIIRQKLKTNTKALILLISFSLGSAAGIYTLGLFAGTLFIFPTALVIMAILYSKKTTWLYTFLYLAFFAFTGIMFCFGMTKLPFSADHLFTNYFHWTVYFFCIIFFFTVTVVTIYSYRSSMENMLKKIVNQRDELAQTNIELEEVSSLLETNNQKLSQKNDELQAALKKVKILTGLLPICSSCKKIRDDKGYWQQIEAYLSEHSDIEFSHSICQECKEKLYPNLAKSR